MPAAAPASLRGFLLKKFHLASVYAVDKDSNMIQVASRNLKGIGNVSFIESDISTASLPPKIDVIFSNATIHWILDHCRLFENLWRLLNDGGEMIIQCGGYGNLYKVLSVIDKIRLHDEFNSFFTDWREPWYFPKPKDTFILLQEIGFANVNVQLVNESAKFSDRNSFALFAKTVVMKPYLAFLPNPKLKDRFLELVLGEIETKHKSLCWLMDYVRLNIKATKNN
jgi:trans-aconitate methyltransferase